MKLTVYNFLNKKLNIFEEMFTMKVENDRHSRARFERGADFLVGKNYTNVKLSNMIPKNVDCFV